MKKDIRQPPQWAIKFFRWYCKSEIAEDIEGDLLERFQYNVETRGSVKASWDFIFEIISLLRPGILKNPFLFLLQNPIQMNTRHWLKLISVNLFIVIAISLPFMPGPPNRIVIAVSGFIQSAGFIGLIFLPMGIVWLAIEIFRSRKSENIAALKNWTYGLGLAAIVLAFLICIVFAVFVFIEVGYGWGIIVAGLFITVFIYLFRSLNREKKKQFSFSTVPLYLLSIPLIALAARKMVVQPLSDFSRMKTIERGNKIISAIESFRDKNYRYPESLEELKQSDLSLKANTNVMGILNFRYNKVEEGYSLSFSQWLDMGSLEEIVLYDKFDLRSMQRPYDYSDDLVRVNYAFDSYDTKFADWRYYHSD